MSDIESGCARARARLAASVAAVEDAVRYEQGWRLLAERAMRATEVARERLRVRGLAAREQFAAAAPLAAIARWVARDARGPESWDSSEAALADALKANGLARAPRGARALVARVRRVVRVRLARPRERALPLRSRLAARGSGILRAPLAPAVPGLAARIAAEAAARARQAAIEAARAAARREARERQVAAWRARANDDVCIIDLRHLTPRMRARVVDLDGIAARMREAALAADAVVARAGNGGGVANAYNGGWGSPETDAWTAAADRLGGVVVLATRRGARAPYGELAADAAPALRAAGFASCAEALDALLPLDDRRLARGLARRDAHRGLEREVAHLRAALAAHAPTRVSGLVSATPAVELPPLEALGPEARGAGIARELAIDDARAAEFAAAGLAADPGAPPRVPRAGEALEPARDEPRRRLELEDDAPRVAARDDLAETRERFARLDLD